MNHHYIARNCEAVLSDWLQVKHRKPLIIRGARQTGKSTLVREFARKTEHQLIEINLEESLTFVRQSFETGNFSEIITTLERVSGQSLKDPKSKILFLDEIQAIPMALQSLRYFYENKPDLAVIAAGSTLEFILAAPTFSMPVGRVEFLALAPLTFKEYLLARHQSDLVQVIETAHPKDPASISHAQHHQLMRYLLDFFLVGGMPEAVAASVENGSSSAVCRSLLSAYRSDLQKYPATAHIRDIVRDVFDRAPGFIGRRIKYSKLAPDRTARDVRKALNLLIESGVVLECVHTHANGVPLLAEVEREIRKLFLLDIGLMLTAQEINKSDLSAWDDPEFVNGGAIAEQFVAQELSATQRLGEKSLLTYWLRETKSQNAEVDFVIALGKRVIPIEVKAGATGTLRSLHEFCKAKQSQIAVRLDASLPSLFKADNEKLPMQLISLPLYMSSEILRIIKSCE